MEQEKQTNRVSRIEEFLLDPEKTLFELLEEFGGSVEEIRNALSQIDVANLETLKGEDGKTPERGVDYFTDEDLDNIEAFILDRIPVVGEDVPSPKQVNEYIDKQVAKIPRVKGDKGNPGTPGKPGKDGSPDSALDIIKKLRSLDKNQGLQLNDVRGLSKKIALLNEVSDEFTQLKEDLNKIKIFSSGAGSDGAGAVASVNGKTGVVVLTQDDIGNGTTYVRTENNFTDALLSKLTGLQTSYSFLNLTDTPSAYTGQQGKFVKVNATNDGLEFASISGGGDMLASTYDPDSIQGDAFDMDNMAQGTTNKFLSSAELTVVQNTSGINTGDQDATDFDIKDLTDSTNLRTTWSGKQDALGFTPENVANKVTSFQVTPDDSHYPSEKLVKDSLDAKVEDSIVDGHTTIAPSGNAVFDALALKAPLASPTFTTQITTPKIIPTSNDSGAIGESGNAFSDLFLADGSVVNFNSGDVLITHSSNKLAFTGGSYDFTGNISSTGTLTINGDSFILRSENQYQPQTNVYSYSNSIASAYSTILKARGTISSPSAVQANDYLGTFLFKGYANGDFRNASLIESIVTGVSGNNVAADLKISNSDTSGNISSFTVKSDGTLLSLPSYSKTVGSTNRDLYIDNTGIIGYVSSASRYKKEIYNMTDISWLYDLRPVNFLYKNDETKTTQYGLVAEEVEKVNKDFVSYNEDGEIETVSYSKLVVPLLKAIQDQKKEIDLLKNEIELLKNK